MLCFVHVYHPDLSSARQARPLEMNDAPLQDTNMPDALSSGLDVPVSADTATTIPIEKLLSATPIAAPQPQVDRVADVLMSDSAAIYPTVSPSCPDLIANLPFPSLPSQHPLLPQALFPREWALQCAIPMAASRLLVRLRKSQTP